MARYLGIDPGLGGGLALIETKEGAPPAFLAGTRVPIVKNRGKSMIDARALLVWLDEGHPILSGLPKNWSDGRASTPANAQLNASRSMLFAESPKPALRMHDFLP